MKITAILHRHGGRITSLASIVHETHKRRASWYFRGRVEWFDGTVSESASIPPTCLVMDDNNAEAAKTECDAALASLTDYLNRNGSWIDCVWKPDERSGWELLA